MKGSQQQGRQRQEGQARRSSFKRQPRGNLTLEKSIYYEAVLFYLWRIGILEAPQIARLTGQQQRRANDLLRRLFDHGYVYRVPRAIRQGQGAKSLIYALSKKGAEYLTEQGYAMPKRRWYERAQVADSQLGHRLLVAEVMVSMVLATRKAELQLIWGEDIAAEAKSFRWAVTLDKQRYFIEPDKVFAVQVGEKLSYFCLEADRGTESIKAKSLKKASIRRKLLSYQYSYQHKLLKERYDFDNFRVLFVGESAPRLENMLTAVRELDGAGKGLFWCLLSEELSALADDLAAPMWQVAQQENLQALLTP